MDQGPLKRGGGTLAALTILFATRLGFAQEEPEPAPNPPVEPVPAPALAPEPSPSALPEKVDEVQIAGARTEAERLQQSADAVNVVDTRKAKERAADLGEVLARTQGVAVRRDGGLGSNARFALNGVYDWIPFYLDGVPLEVAGYPFGIANVPVSLVERVEVYRGVVPIRFGGDGIGGAVNVVGDPNYDTHASASYQTGSFGTQRLTLHGRYRHEPTGLVASSTLFLDAARNNYDVDVEVPDARGRPQPVTVRRFNDAYRAGGATVEVGVVDRPWARRLLVRGFVSSYDKELQHNALMTVPYGEVRYGESVKGGSAVYEVPLASNVLLETVASYAHRTIDLDDQSEWVYSWTGRRVNPRRTPGEIDTEPSDQTVWQDTLYGRAQVEWSVVPKKHVLRAMTTPTFTTRSGEERRRRDPTQRDPLTALRDLFTLVSGLEYDTSLFGGRLENVAFLKDYLFQVSTEEALPGNASYRREDVEHHRQGIGDSLRFRFTPWFLGKASYEFASRLPRPHEIFGDGVLVQPNLKIAPEVSHNGNVGPRFELRKSPAGSFTVDVNAFVRESENMVVLLGGDRLFAYQNIYSARGLGLENAVHWISPGRWLTLDGMLTYQDIRNRATEGTFRDFEGDRVPNRPYLFASWSARLRFENAILRRDAVEPFYDGRFVEGFFRGWESQGVRAFKQTVDAQVTHNIGLTWIVQRAETRVTSTLEVDNVTDARVFDNFGVQRPGRAYYVKTTLEL